MYGSYVKLQMYAREKAHCTKRMTWAWPTREWMEGGGGDALLHTPTCGALPRLI